MTDELFDIYFSGRVLPDNELELVKQKVGKIFNANAKVLEQLFSGNPVKIKKSVNMDTAIKYRVKFREIGAIVDIRPSQGNATPAAQQATEQESPATSTGAQSEAVEPAPVAVKETTIAASLAAVGSTLDETPEPPPAHFAIDNLELGPANQGSLLEFAENVVPAPIPDISALDISDSTQPLDETPPPAPISVDTSQLDLDQSDAPLDDTPTPEAVDIDTSKLTATEANTGSLEEFNSRPEPAPLPDISKLDVV